MGMFLSLSGIIGKTHFDVADTLLNYAKSVKGGLQQLNLDPDHNNFCVIKDADVNTTIFYPYNFLEWDKSSAFLSKELNAAVFSCHIHDGDLWMYILYFNGEIVDQFNPIPDYWDDNISEEEMQRWKGNPETVSKYVPGLHQREIAKYLVRWNPEAEENDKAYPEDEFTNEDWQLLDFMRKIGIPYPLDDDGKPTGQAYKLWTKELPLETLPPPVTRGKQTAKAENTKKPWWKFW